SALGGAGNIITIHTFLRMGCSDAVNLSLAWLAMSDLLFLVSVLVNSAALILKSVEELTGYRLWFPVEPEAVYIVFTNTGAGSYAITMLITTFITIVRCLGVVKPLHFRNLLSWNATVAILSLFSSLSALSVILLLAYLGITPQLDPNLNSTRPTLWFSPRRKFIKDVIFALRDAMLPFVSQVLVSICVVIMASSLRRSSKFRERHGTTVNIQIKQQNSGSSMRIPRRNTGSGTNLSPSDRYRGNFDRTDQTLVSSSTAQFSSADDDIPVKLACKGLQAVRQMLIIASFYTVCNLPKVATNLAELSVPGFSLGHRYQTIYNTVDGIRELFQTINAAAGFLIYMSFNSMFRR
ncbi:unnamed protein product, partial [Lymnaea stagnalis]